MDAPCQTAETPGIPRRFISDVQQLRAALMLSETMLPAGNLANGQFRLKVPEAFLRRIRPGDPNDPLLLQIWPSPREERETPGYRQDPNGEHAAAMAPGLLQKYAGRALLVTTGACAIHCRYCFRRHFPYQDHRDQASPWESALAAIRTDTSLEEIILSGGDPLTLSVQRLTTLFDQLSSIRHVKRIRIHSRLPVVAPERVTPSLLALMDDFADHLVMVIHTNHPRELDPAAETALRGIHGTGVQQLNQSVLLRGVNDSAECLISLSRRLFECHVLPYYLHQLDPVAGAAHFQVTDDEAVALVEAMRRALPGYLVPRLVREREGAAYKLPL
ncbi:MAG: EF-P beta-lysylation protein EpmB [Gammaproteobacteria bacterium]